MSRQELLDALRRTADRIDGWNNLENDQIASAVAYGIGSALDTLIYELSEVDS